VSTDPFLRLKRERQRLAIIRPMALAYGCPDLVWLIERYAKRLAALASMCGPMDGPYLAGRIGPNDMGEALADIAWRIRFERDQRRASATPLRRAA